MSSCCPDLEILRSLFLLRFEIVPNWGDPFQEFACPLERSWKYEALKKVLNVHTAVLYWEQEVQLISLDNSGRISTCDHHVVFDKHHNISQPKDFKTPHINASTHWIWAAANPGLRSLLTSDRVLHTVHLEGTQWSWETPGGSWRFHVNESIQVCGSTWR